MSVQKMWAWPATVLDTPCKSVEVFDASLGKLLDDCRDTMLNLQGAGLAANQIGVSLRAAVVQLSKSEDGSQVQILDIVNPEIISRQDPVDLEEGCLSLPNQRHLVKRFKEVALKFQDRTGTQHFTSFTGDHAHIVQHEVDHLNGIVYVRHLSHLKRELIRKKMVKFQNGINQSVMRQHVDQILKQKVAKGEVNEKQAAMIDAINKGKR